MVQEAAFCVTTTLAAGSARTRTAERFAHRWRVPFEPRSSASFADLRQRYAAVLVFEELRVRMADHAGDVAYHPGMAYRRADVIVRGGNDPLTNIAGIESGMAVCDATAGLGRDVLVAASVVGSSGRVIGLEANAGLAAFVSAGVETCLLPPGTSNHVGTIHIEHAEAVSWLRRTADRFDVAVVDPMFDRPQRAEPTFAMLRRHAYPTGLNDELVRAALDRATRVVVRVGHPVAFERLSLGPVRVARSGKTYWGVFED